MSNNRPNRYHRGNRPNRDNRENREPRENRENDPARENRESRPPRENHPPRDNRAPRDNRPQRENRPQQNNNEPREFAPQEFFPLGQHPIGNRLYMFLYNGVLYRITEKRGEGEDAPVVTLLEEKEATKAYDAWNHIKRPERFGGMVTLPTPPAVASAADEE